MYMFISVIHCIKIFQNTDDYFLIKSTIGVEMVMDVKHSNPDPGTRVISYCQNNPELMHNQLWKKEWASENTFYLVSKLGPDCKMTIRVIISCSLYTNRTVIVQTCFLEV